MEQETTWVVNLIKYMPEAARKEGAGLQETIDKYTVSEEELFGERIDSDVEKITNEKQFSPMLSTSEDRWKEIDDDLKILSYNLDIHGIVVAESIYDMNTSSIFNAIVYKNSNDIISASCDRAITIWLNSRKDEGQEFGAEDSGHTQETYHR